MEEKVAETRKRSAIQLEMGDNNCPAGSKTSTGLLRSLTCPAAEAMQGWIAQED
jgi:hypothetical protein